MHNPRSAAWFLFPRQEADPRTGAAEAAGAAAVAGSGCGVCRAARVALLDSAALVAVAAAAAEGSAGRASSAPDQLVGKGAELDGQREYDHQQAPLKRPNPGAVARHLPLDVKRKITLLGGARVTSVAPVDKPRRLHAGVELPGGEDQEADRHGHPESGSSGPQGWGHSYVCLGRAQAADECPDQASHTKQTGNPPATGVHDGQLAVESPARLGKGKAVVLRRCRRG